MRGSIRAGITTAAVAVVACGAPPANGPDDGPQPQDTGAGSGSDAPPVVADPCFPDPGPGHRVYACNGIDFDVEVPPACAGGGCGIILDVHGLTMSAAMED